MNTVPGARIESPMASLDQEKKAEALRALHFGEEPLLLVNVWDVASARMIEAAGFPAIATTSAGIAFAHGYPDGQKIPPEHMFAAVWQIANGVKAPVTADVEAGYGTTPESAMLTASSVINAGAVGMNFEDAEDDPVHPLADLSLQLERIRAIRETAARLNVPLVLNARTDVYLKQVGEPSKRYDEALRRLSAYRDAGADCVFISGLTNRDTISRFVADLRCPINILAVPGQASVAELNGLGVKRISLGSGPMRAGLGILSRIAEELKTSGTYSGLENAPSHLQINELMRSCESQ